MKLTFIGTRAFIKHRTKRHWYNAAYELNLSCTLLVLLFFGLNQGVGMAKTEDPLKSYRKRRDVGKSGEPVGSVKHRGSKKVEAPIFVVHKHAASHLHYDLRLEVDGVLKSWAVPKGFSQDPAQKHLAIPTEDHPYEYAKFEGVIAPGNYGAGTVMIWDTGTYRNLKTHDMAQCVKDGKIEVELRGKKMRGSYALIRTKNTQWLVFKMKDDAFSSKKAYPNDARSAITGRTMNQIAKQADDDSINVGRHVVKLTNQDKILFPKDDITKGDLINYALQIAPTMVPHMKNRAVTMHRFPDGIDKEGFYQKDISDYFPDWIKHVLIPKQGGKSDYVVCNDAATLVYLANQACITPHLWLSRTDKLDYPDRMIFDLDPGDKDDFPLVRRAALDLHSLLNDLGLTSFVMTTGSRGLHVVVPLNRKMPFDAVRACARQIAERLIAQRPDQFTIEARLAKRRGRLFIDVTRNAFAQTTVAPYAVRAKPGAPVATPIRWEELERGKVSAQSFTIKNIFKRLEQSGDPWKDINRHGQSLTKACKKFSVP